MGILGVITFILFLALLAGIQGYAHKLGTYQVSLTLEERTVLRTVSWVLVAVIGINGLWVLDTYVYKIPNPFGPPTVEYKAEPQVDPVPTEVTTPLPPVHKPNAIADEAKAHQERLENW